MKQYSEHIEALHSANCSCRWKRGELGKLIPFKFDVLDATRI